MFLKLRIKYINPMMAKIYIILNIFVKEIIPVPNRTTSGKRYDKNPKDE